MTEDATVFNPQLVLISGESATGKSASLRNIREQSKWMFLNAEAGKRLPFKNTFDSYTVTDPYQVYEGLDAMKNGDIDRIGAIIDTTTFLMDMFESMYVIPAVNTQTAWGQYAQFWKVLLQDKIASLGRPVILLAHTRSDLDEKAMEMRTKVPIKGSLKNNGVEAYFSTVVSTKKMPLKELEEYKNSMLHIEEEDEMLGYKHVFQTKLTKKTVGESIRSPMGMFTRNETFIDNDAQLLLDHLKDFYA